MLRRRDAGVNKIEFVDIDAPEYDPAQNSGISYEQVSGTQYIYPGSSLNTWRCHPEHILFLTSSRVLASASLSRKM